MLKSGDKNPIEGEACSAWRGHGRKGLKIFRGEPSSGSSSGVGARLLSSGLLLLRVDKKQATTRRCPGGSIVLHAPRQISWKRYFFGGTADPPFQSAGSNSKMSTRTGALDLL